MTDRFVACAAHTCAEWYSSILTLVINAWMHNRDE